MSDITYEMIQKANESIKTTSIKGKDYAEVNQRIKAFRMVYPEGQIITEMLSNENGICIFKATVKSKPIVIGWNGEEHFEDSVLGTGTAYEKEDSTFINKTSYIENCETSAVGRALGMAGFGIDTSVASAEEVGNAIANQDYEITYSYKDVSGKEIKPKIMTTEELYKYAESIGWTADVVRKASQNRFGLNPEELTEKQIAEAAELLKPREENK